MGISNCLAKPAWYLRAESLGISWHLVAYLNIALYLSASHNISLHLSASRGISLHLVSSHSISWHLAAYPDISQHLASSQNISRHLRASRSIPVHHGVSLGISWHLLPPEKNVIPTMPAQLPFCALRCSDATTVCVVSFLSASLALVMLHFAIKNLGTKSCAPPNHLIEDPFTLPGLCSQPLAASMAFLHEVGWFDFPRSLLH